MRVSGIAKFREKRGQRTANCHRVYVGSEKASGRTNPIQPVCFTRTENMAAVTGKNQIERQTQKSKRMTHRGAARFPIIPIRGACPEANWPPARTDWGLSSSSSGKTIDTSPGRLRPPRFRTRNSRLRDSPTASWLPRLGLLPASWLLAPGSCFLTPDS